MSVFRNVMVYLGLGADEEYDDDYLAGESPEDEPAQPDRFEQPRAAAPVQRSAPARSNTAVRSGFNSGAAATDRPSAVGAVRPLRSVPSGDDSDDRSSEDGVARMSVDESRVRAVPIQRSKPRALSPQSFGDAKTVADELRKSVPVIMNLRSLDRDLARRLIDFASGSTYSLGGKMEKIAPQVFLLIPKSVEISDDDRRRIDERGFDRD